MNSSKGTIQNEETDKSITSTVSTVPNKYIGIDYGTKRVGVAISDDRGSMAFPREIILNNGLSRVVDEIYSISVELQTKIIILGESKNFKGEDNIIMKEIREFVKHLEDKGLTVIFESEIFSTQQAERLQGRRDNIDSSAAAVILQSYIDRMKKQVDDNQKPQKTIQEINDLKYEQYK